MGSYGQTTTISGVVRDTTTNERMSYVKVRFQNVSKIEGCHNLARDARRQGGPNFLLPSVPAKQNKKRPVITW